MNLYHFKYYFFIIKNISKTLYFPDLPMNTIRHDSQLYIFSLNLINLKVWRADLRTQPYLTRDLAAKKCYTLMES